MRLCKFTINGHEVEFINNTRGTRSGFAHDSTVYIDGVKYGAASCNYYNRTWERYTYQSVMLAAVSDLLAKQEKDIITLYKCENNLQRMTGKRRAAALAAAADDPNIKIYNAVRDHLYNNICYSY